jgi:hypothetical protein
VSRVRASDGIAGEIVCPECDGSCAALSTPPADGFAPGDVVAYRCRDCLERWDVVVPEEGE